MYYHSLARIEIVNIKHGVLIGALEFADDYDDYNSILLMLLNFLLSSTNHEPRDAVNATDWRIGKDVESGRGEIEIEFGTACAFVDDGDIDRFSLD